MQNGAHFVLNWKTPYIPLPSLLLGTLSFLSALCLAFFLVVVDFFLGESILAICSCSWLRLSSISSSISWSELYSAESSSLSLSTTPFSTTTVQLIQYLTMYAYRRKETAISVIWNHADKSNHVTSQSGIFQNTTVEILN